MGYEYEQQLVGSDIPDWHQTNNIYIRQYDSYIMDGLISETESFSVPTVFRPKGVVATTKSWHTSAATMSEWISYRNN